MQESTWIERYIVPLVDAPGADGLRDDVATLSTPGLMIATMDALVEGVHFLDADPLDTVGQKLVRVNVSDIYAKGAKPAVAHAGGARPDGTVHLGGPFDRQPRKPRGGGPVLGIKTAEIDCRGP